MRGVLVTGTDTGVGKTIVSATLTAAIAASGQAVRAHKPVLTGTDESRGEKTAGSWPADDELLGTAAGMAAAEVAPVRYGPAVSPHLAAALAGERLDLPGLVARARAGAEGRVSVIEGIGGLLTPLSDEATVCDLARALALPVVIASRPALGTINHTLLTLAVARSAGLDVRAVVITPWPRRPGPLERSNRETIAQMGAVAVATLPLLDSSERAALARAGEELPWRGWVTARDALAAQGSR